MLQHFHQKFNDITGYSISSLQEELVVIKENNTDIDKWEAEIRNELKINVPKIDTIEFSNIQS